MALEGPEATLGTSAPEQARVSEAVLGGLSLDDTVTLFYFVSQRNQGRYTGTVTYVTALRDKLALTIGGRLRVFLRVHIYELEKHQKSE